jgi:hypothetical protein
MLNSQIAKGFGVVQRPRDEGRSLITADRPRGVALRGHSSLPLILLLTSFTLGKLKALE